jgi:hypothetical protein
MQQPPRKRIPEETASQLLRLSPTPSTPSLPRRPAAASSAPAAYHPARPPSPTAAASLDLCWRGATEVAASRDGGERCGGGSGDREGRGRSVATRWLWARASASAQGCCYADRRAQDAGEEGGRGEEARHEPTHTSRRTDGEQGRPESLFCRPVSAPAALAMEEGCGWGSLAWPPAQKGREARVNAPPPPSVSRQHRSSQCGDRR